MGDSSGAVLSIHFKSFKSRPVTRSVLAGEFIAFCHIFDVATTVANERQMVTWKKLPVQPLTDSKSISDVV